MALPIIVAVGSALIRTTAKQLPKILRRFKNAKEVKSPTSSQIDRAGTITKDLGNFSSKTRSTLTKADTARPSIVESLTGTGRTAGQKTMRNVTTGEARRTATKGAAATAAAGAAGYGLGRKTDTKTEDKPAAKKPVAKEKLPMPKTLPKSKPKKKAKNTSMFDTTGTMPGNTITDKRKKGK